MDDVTRHPDDETLFDLLEGTLDAARAEQVRLHLSRCAACAAFVKSASSTMPLLGAEAVEQMPVAAAEQLHAAVAGAWRERVAGIAASERAADAAVVSDVGTTPIEPQVAPQAAPAERAPRGARRRGRRLIPVLAFVVLGSLAGGSFLVGQQAPSSSQNASEDASSVPSSSAPSPDAQRESSQEQEFDEGFAGDATASAPAAGASSSAEVDPSAQPDTGAGAGIDLDPAAPIEPPSSDYDDFVEQQRVCIATRDESQLTLPDGRIPQQIVRGPFGTYLVCG